MALKRVRYEDDDEAFRVEGGGRLAFARNGDLVVPLDASADISVAHFATALKRYEDYYGGDLEWIFISETPAAGFDPNSAARDVALSYSDGVLSAMAGFVVDADSVPRSPETAALVAPLLARHQAAWTGSWTDHEGGYVSVGVSARLTGGRRSLGELHQLGREMQWLLDAAGGHSELSARMALDLLKAGRTDVIVGQPESSWLDAKRQPYTLATDGQKWELAKDVAAFANADSDALILLGIATRQTPNGDFLDSTRAFRIADMDVPATRAVLRERITPVIPNVDVGVVETRSGYGYGWIFIPQQPRELYPFIVTGVQAGATWLGRHLSVPIRIGEDTVYLDAAALHSMLAAGRVALRQLPGPS
jgi:hypothetical protein